ncbi:nucleoside-diphosphate-sugar epimerase [Candidatus Magnetobacterium bavaricum]|uniref:Nucleoside-diphosphate-sugar epimerase n=1 Tax=Candidatus Magnetobacterium bavaricum TaxID=29290 RepID=A0A0F3GTS6_9BACT|nr:nucleoside-diphosphate-sugar epimerase [Candidatus Magnetobacterium bavaricum]
MIALVTGINGFIGNNLSKVLLSKGYIVKGTVRSIVKSTSMPNLDIYSINSIGPTTIWQKALKGVDIVIHLAAKVHVTNDTSDKNYIHINTLGTERLAIQAAKAGVKRMIFLSTIKVNGEITSNKPFTEEDHPLPKDYYALSKLKAEQSLLHIAKTTELEVVIIRSPLVYGAGVKGNFYRLLKLIQMGIPLPLRNINNKRSLIYIGNLIDVIITCLQHPSAVNNTFLVSDGEDLSTPVLIRQIAMIWNKSAKLFPLPSALLYLAGAITGKLKEIRRLTESLLIDSSKIRDKLDWTPPFTVEQGLRDTAEWFRLNEHRS